MSFQYDRKAMMLQHIVDWSDTVYWLSRLKLSAVTATVVNGSLEQLLLFNQKGNIAVVCASVMQYLNRNGFDDNEIIALCESANHYHADGNDYSFVCTTFPND